MSPFTRRILFVILGSLILLLFTVALLRDTVGREWLWHQITYASTYAKDAGTAPKGKVIADALGQTIAGAPPMGTRKFGIQQVVLDDFRFSNGSQRVDRCMSCHVGIADLDPARKREEIPQPYRAHPGDLLVSHPVEKFGCTVCHQGQGIALKADPAHGYHSHTGADGKTELTDAWHHVDNPMLLGGNIQSACVTCHTGGAWEPAKGRRPAKDHTPLWTRGRALFESTGCIGCHAMNGEGGEAAPELSEVGSKFPDQFDMRHLKGPHSVQNWLYEHFIDPQAVVQDDKAIGINFPSDMPNAEQLGITEADARALTVFVLSLNTNKVYAKYMRPGPAAPAAPRFASRVEKGRYLYRKLGCIGCHGKEGLETDIRKNWNAVGGVVPKLGNLAEKYSREELKEFILRGSMPPKADESLETPPLWMPTWKKRGLGGDDLEAIADFLFTLKLKKKAGEEDF